MTREAVDTLACDAEVASGTARLWVSKQDKPEQVLARHMVVQVAIEYRHITGALPPSGQPNWFSDFMKALGERVRLGECARLMIGARITSSVVREMQSDLGRAAARAGR